MQPTVQKYINVFYNIVEIFSHLSNKDRNLDELPSIREEYIAREMDKRREVSERVQHNKNVNEHNKTIIRGAFTTTPD
jgi:hypothetical protein